MRRIIFGIARRIEWLIQAGPAGVLRHPPIFIIGPPRSGSTLMMQLMMTRYRFATLTNWSAKHSSIPYLASRFVKTRWGYPPPSDFKSNYAEIPGPNAANEAGHFWYQWFPRNPPHAPAGTLSDDQIQSLRRAVAAISNAWNAPPIFKTMVNTNRVGALIEAFPNTLFVVMRRSLADIAASSLQARRAQYGNDATWFSVRPRETALLRNLDPYQQVAGQAHYIANNIDDDIQLHGSERFFEVHYDELCADVHKVMDAFDCFAQRHDLRLEHMNDIPTSFSPSKPRISDEEWKKVFSACMHFVAAREEGSDV